MKAIKNAIRFSILSVGAILYGHSISALGANVTVSTGFYFFSPQNVTINVGDSVTWTGLPAGGHTSTSSDGLWNGSANNFAFTFNSAGTFNYFCIPHQSLGMVGSVTVKAAAPVNTPPTVSITSPVSGAVLSAPANVTLQASAADSDGSVTNVQFLIGSTVLANVTSAPFSAVANNLSAGSYTLSAIASDNLGAKATNSVTIVVDAQPTVAITKPANGITLSAPASLTLTANPTDADGSVTNVQFWQGATLLGNVATEPFSISANNLAAADYTFSAIVSDNDGATATNSILIHVINPGPVTISAPAVLSAGQFQFSYASDIGLTYVVQVSTNLFDWNPINTNTATVNPTIFTDPNANTGGSFYRVGRLPNP